MMAAKTLRDATDDRFGDVTPTASATATAFALPEHLTRPSSTFTLTYRRLN